MKVLIVQSNAGLAGVWKKHLERQSAEVTVASTEKDALACMHIDEFDVVVLDLVIDGGNSLTVSDFAQYRMPHAPVIFVTNTSFFSDGSIFRHCANACAFLPCATEPQDLALMIEHYAQSTVPA